VLNDYRTVELGLAPSVEEVIFIGAHVYQRRIVDDGYTIDDAVDQLVSAMDAQAVVVTGARLTTIQNHTPRADRYGNQIRDMGTLVCTSKHPRPELYGLSPKGTSTNPQKQKSRPKAALCKSFERLDRVALAFRLTSHSLR
jgi:hypothetical protein